MADLNLIRPEPFADDPDLVAAFTTREGGVSQGPYRSLNLGMSTGDSDENVQENRRRLCRELGMPVTQLALAGQVHGSDVTVIDAPGLYPGFDGLVTSQTEVLLAIVAADCAAVLLADQHAGVIGACHAGWRGAASGVVERTLDVMGDQGAESSRVQGYVSPCISVDAYEVGEEVAEQFDSTFVRRASNEPRPHVDLKRTIRAQLTEGGVPEAQLEIDPQCTHREADRFYSHRASGGTTGRMMGLIARRGEEE